MRGEGVVAMASCRMPCPGHLLLLLLLLLAHHYHPAHGTLHVKSEEWWEGRPRPYFAHSPTNVTVISGQTSFLPCRVHMLGDRSVMWMRGRDLHILTVGKVTYSADERFQPCFSVMCQGELLGRGTCNIFYVRNEAADKGTNKELAKKLRTKSPRVSNK